MKSSPLLWTAILRPRRDRRGDRDADGDAQGRRRSRALVDHARPGAAGAGARHHAVMNLRRLAQRLGLELPLALKRRVKRGVLVATQRLARKLDQMIVPKSNAQ